MKKTLICTLSLIVCLFLFGSVIAGPEQVKIVPISKWNYKDVDGWGFYAKGGEYSWFGFILNNPGSTNCTVTLPIDVDVAHRSMHKIVNNQLTIMKNGTVDFLNPAYEDQYFVRSFTLPKNSTYAVFFDITEMQPYTGQWDTDVFFSVQINDKSKSVSLPVTGVLAYDARNQTPQKLEIIIPSTDPISTSAFCRSYDSNTKKISFAYTLKNESGGSIPVELAKSLEIEGQSVAAGTRYTNCASGGKSCLSRITKDGLFEMNAGETVKFIGEASVQSKPSKTNFYVKTSLRYSYNGEVFIPFIVGEATTACTDPTTPVPETPTVTVTPAPTGEGLVNVSFCRNYDAQTNKVSFTYAIKNKSSVTIPVELATSLAIEGQSKAVAIRTTGCVSGSTSCMSRITKDGGFSYFSLKAGETAAFSGEAVLTSKPSKNNFYIKTSLRYDFNGRKQIPFLVGYTANTCSVVPPTVTPEPVSEGLANISFCRNYNAQTNKVTFTYALKNKSSVIIPVELATSLAIEGQSETAAISITGCVSGGNSCMARITKNGKFSYISLNAGETAEFSGEAVLKSKPAKNNFFIKTSLRYDFNGRKQIPFLVGYTTNACSAAHAASADEIVLKSAEIEGNTVNLSLMLSNEKDTEMTILPGAVVLSGKAISNYQGYAAIAPLDEEMVGQSNIVFNDGEEFTLPPFCSANIEISLTAEPGSDNAVGKDILWVYSINGTANRFTFADAPAKTLINTEEPAEKDNHEIDVYRIELPRIPDRLPATGFSARRMTNLSVQPADLAYQSINDLNLSIPVLNTSAEIVRIPLNEKGEWAIEWLNDRAGVLEGTALPGNGVSVIAAHNHLNDTDNGPFIGLSLLENKDRIFVEDNKGQVLSFSVYANTLLSPNDGAKIYEKAKPGSLVLLTCENELQEGGYANRRAVFAEPVQ